MDKMRRVMIACVTFDTVRISQPVEFYGSNVVYLIHYVRDPEKPGNVYREFYIETVRQIMASNKNAEIMEINAPVTDFKAMLKAVSGAIYKEKQINPRSEIRVNLSAGSPEYITAAGIAAMMNKGAEPFFVRADAYTVPDKEVEKVYFRDGKPVGLISSVKDVVDMPPFTVEMPDEKLVKALRVFAEMISESPTVSSSEVISTLQSKGLWTKRNHIDGNSDTVYYQRKYIDVWIARGWIERLGGKRSGYKLTENGAIIIDSLWNEVETEDAAVN
ncbi:hypothetical protein AUQ37_05030 [Candidatus Methanomethylophilus sp. 1R26]|jgi:hypothetical protein|uniref:HFX_2341 family transcriptional regulator domain-containing protein n=1 Tax=Candidatus Methanomethylophilus sp. 1R26 TaxID=1769296 RepID=UPI0007378611|nr:DUF6293 family protein [Candidatus Methanomethylophilus sp. 1R26]MCH3977760.1 DUF6293 family protein [Methanomethylophilus sp.]TQS79043.1 MAG: hypothetical protein A3Q59_01725 [Methanomethylophilus alvi]WII09312.1 DUF6293 family protein [Methanomassiliicoccales archaeon LGM-DZ1]KUE74264.1 hypothetical protein AUQ37_05030 [Candidatus Methanomethylophilus sp. 1R26]MCI2074133.1 DUF6293 family protein [Methanomethylophilus sp.]